MDDSVPTNRILFWLLTMLSHTTPVLSYPCSTNEILLRSGACYCPFFKFNGLCMRQRYQTTVNTTLDNLYTTSRHLLSAQPMLLTIDASNPEAMQALAASLQMIRSVGTVVTRMVDSIDTLVGGDASATLEIVNATFDAASSSLALTVDFRFPLVDYFYLYMHLGSSTPPCPPFDSANLCCYGKMQPASEFSTAVPIVDCTSNNPFAALDAFVAHWNGQYLTPDKQTILFVINLASTSLPSTLVQSDGSRIYRFGIGMVVFGLLAQNTEARVELCLNSSSTYTSVGAFQYSGVEYSRLQLEGCAGVTFAHLIVKASGIQSVQNVRYQTWDGGAWLTPNCSVNASVMLGTTRLSACNVSIDSEFVDVYVSLKGIVLNQTIALYVLLQQDSILTRVVAKTDNTIVDHCSAPVTISTTANDAFTIQVMQGSTQLYSGPVELVQLTEVAALTLSIVSKSTLYAYAFDNISVVYSLVPSNQILGLMTADGQITTALENMCSSGMVCLIEQLMLGGVCQTGEKCEVQGGSLFLMPMYPWGAATLKNGTYTVMIADIKETLLPNPDSTNGGGLIRRLMSWMRGR